MVIFDIRKDDVLLGRGALTVNNEGNKSFRSIVEPWKTEYQGANRKRKNEIALIVVNEVFHRNGRFLERISDVHMKGLGLPEHSRAWKVAEMHVALEKAKQALRSKDHDSSCVPIQPESALVPAQDDVPAIQHHFPQQPTATGSRTHDQDDSQSYVDISNLMTDNSGYPTPRFLDQRNQDLLNPFLGGMHVNEQEQIDRLLRHDGGASITASTTVHATAHPSPHDSVLLNELARIEQQHQEMIDGVHASVQPDIER